MSRPSNKAPMSNRALEMIMRDVLGGMEELSLRSGYETQLEDDFDFQLIREAPEPDQAKILYFPQPLRRIA